MSRDRRSLFVCLAGVLATVTIASDWPRWRGPQGNGISSEQEWTSEWPSEGPPMVWKALVGTGFSSVVVADGRLFTMGNSKEVDTVSCLDADTGRPLWRHSYPCPLDPQYYEGGPGATPAVAGDQVFTLSKHGHLFCLEAASGTARWIVNLTNVLGVTRPRWGFAGSPVVAENQVVLNAGAAGASVNRLDGQVLWSSGTNAPGYASPVFLGDGADRRIAFFSSKWLALTDWPGGAELVRFPWTTKWDLNAGDPIPVGANRVFISTFDRGSALLEWRGSALEIVWTNRDMATHFSSCVLIDGHLYGIHGNTDAPPRELRCLDVGTGEVRWRYEGLGLGSVTATAGKLIVLSERGEVVMAPASPSGFRPIARAQVLGGKCWTVPVLANGRLYCRNATGSLVCLDLRPRAP